MLLNSQQVAEKLGVSRGVVLAMTKRGELTAVNKPQPGKKKFFPKYDSRVINAYKKANGTPKRSRATKLGGFIGEIKSLSERLTRIESKIDKILGWF